MLYILDYGAGNVRSLANSIKKLGHTFEWVQSPADLLKAGKLLFPGVGAFGPALDSLRAQGYAEPLKQYIASGKPYMGICVGMQALFEASSESPGVPGLGVIPGKVERFSAEDARVGGGRKAVPQMGWNTARVVNVEEEQEASSPHDAATSAHTYGFPSPHEGGEDAAHYYFVHSYRAAYDPELHADWAHTVTQYGSELFLSSVQHGNVFATQFHPEKSGAAGLRVLRAWLERKDAGPRAQAELVERPVGEEGRAKGPRVLEPRERDGLTKRIVACLDVRTNDDGDLVVTKGESYDVREKAESSSTTTKAAGAGAVRNLGKPVDLARRYYLEGADEITFLNITSFRSCPLQDQPMLAVLEHAAADIFVPLTIGGGIKDTVDPDGTPRPALEVAAAYFRAGADKVSIGSEAVYAVEGLLNTLKEGQYDPAVGEGEGTTGIETISKAYGSQAVVVSIDPRRVYLEPSDPILPSHAPSLVHGRPGSAEEGKRWWYRCTVKGGREDRDVDVVQLARGVQRLGAGEILLNSIDRDGSNAGFDRQLVDLVKGSVEIPVIASSGAGNAGHFEAVFSPLAEGEGEGKAGTVEAALAAGIFHRQECTIGEVKEHLRQKGFKIRSEVVEV